ncbi:MAG: beta-propeller fold lactonase family protein [Ferruginibacter sp.]
MKKVNLLKMSLAISVLFATASCKKNADAGLEQQIPGVLTEEMMSEKNANPDEMTVKEQGNLGTEASRDNQHFLYTESNGSGTNEIFAYKIKNDGSLKLKQTVNAGGSGTGSPLGSQGALCISQDNEWLFAINAGSNSVSSFKIQNDGMLMLKSTVNTHGTTPVSVTVSGNLMYVLNRGSDNIHGFHIGGGGSLTPIPGSGKSLSSSTVDAPQISFTPGGEWVIVTEKATNIIGSFKVNNNGSVQMGDFNNSVGQTPFGFSFARNNFMIVSNASGGGAGAGSTTSYRISGNGTPDDVNGAIANSQSAPCWVATTKYGRYAFVTNTASNNISSYYVAPWGGLYLVHSVAAASDMGPLDIVVAANNYYVYVVNAGSHTITGYTRGLFGGLDFLNRELGLPAGTTGLATL